MYAYFLLDVYFGIRENAGKEKKPSAGPNGANNTFKNFTLFAPFLELNFVFDDI